jgi:putative transposase
VRKAPPLVGNTGTVPGKPHLRLESALASPFAPGKSTHRKVANRRKNMLHQRTVQLVRDHSLIITEKLTIPNMTATATVEKPGKRVKQKVGLNRAILDTAPGGFLSNLAYKATEAGCEVVETPARAA